MGGGNHPSRRDCLECNWPEGRKLEVKGSNEGKQIPRRMLVASFSE